MNDAKWPQEIIVVRHGQSAANVARDFADINGLSNIGINYRDMDVPLSIIGEHQARALGKWFEQSFKNQQINIFSSPYFRTLQTTNVALKLSDANGNSNFRVDERLREREFGLITGLTRKGIEEQFPLEVIAYDKIKKFYYRPPGGESWCDVILRVRSFIDMLRRDFNNKQVLVVAHTVVVYAFRYILENLTEQEILEIDKNNDLANCSITSFVKDQLPDRMRVQKFNYVDHLRDLQEPVTRKSDVPKI